MKLARLSLLVVALVAAICSIVDRKPNLARAQTSEAAQSRLAAKPDRTAPREIDFPYYSLRDGTTATLLLVSASPKPLDFTLAIRSLSGQTLLVPLMTIQPQEKMPIDLGQLLTGLGADVTGDFAEGSVAVYFTGTIMPLPAQLTMSNPQRSLSFESEMADNSPGLGLLPKELHGL
jgi:hypothetical protein